MLWMAVHENANGRRNLLRNGDGLTEAAADARIVALRRRAPVGHSYYKFSYTPESRKSVMDEYEIVELDE